MSAVSSVSSQVAASGRVEPSGIGNFEFTVEAFSEHMRTIGHLEILPGKSLTLIGVPLEMLMELVEKDELIFKILDVLAGNRLKLDVGSAKFENFALFTQEAKCWLTVLATETTPLTLRAYPREFYTTVKRVVDWLDARGKDGALPLEPSRRVVFTDVGPDALGPYYASDEPLIKNIKNLFFEKSVLLKEKHLSLSFEMLGPEGCFFTCSENGAELALIPSAGAHLVFFLEPHI